MLKKMDLAQGDAITVGSALTINNNPLYFDLMNKWITPCQGSCDVKFTSDHRETGQGFKADIMFQQPPHGK